MSIKAMRMAIEALEDANDTARMEFSDEDYYLEAINALRQAIKQAEQQEPVGKFAKFSDGVWKEVAEGSAGVLLYTSPSPRQPLTDEEIETIANDFEEGYVFLYRSFARAIESAHGIGEKA